MRGGLGNPPGTPQPAFTTGPAGPAAPDLRVLHINQPAFPELRWEWHPVNQVVYVIRTDTPAGEEVLAEPFAWNITCSGDAWNAVLMWLRGYKHGKAAATLRHPEQRERSDYVVLG